MTDADKMRFSTAMGMLSGAYGRTVEGPVSVAYWTTLNSYQLSIEQVERAVATAIATEPQWMPSPARLAQLAGCDVGDAAARDALAALEDDLNQHGGFRFYPHARFLALPEPLRAGVKRIGGLKAITLGEHTRSSVLKDFCDAYRAPMRALAPPAEKLQLVAHERRQLPRGGEPARIGDIRRPDDQLSLVADMPLEPRGEVSSQYLADVRAAHAWFNHPGHPERASQARVIAARVRRQHPSLPDDHIQIQYQVESALVAAWRSAQTVTAVRP